MKTQTDITIGSTIKSLDFPGIESHYVIGTVFYVDDFTKAYNCEMIKCVRDGIEIPREKTGDYFTVGMIGTHFLDKQWPGRITLV
jgi:hypothetical protein